MKKILFAFLPWLFAAISYKAIAQDPTPPPPPPSKNSKKETQEIIIRKKGDKDVSLNITVNGDQVLINGKPISDFKDEDITINKKKITIRDLNTVLDFGNLDNMSFNFNSDNVKGFGGMGSKTFLGVSTAKDEKGAKIINVTKGSAAEKAGLQIDDIITRIDDKKIDGPEILSEVISSMKPKDEVKVYYLRNRKERSSKTTLQEHKGIDVRSFSFNSPDGRLKNITVPDYPSSNSIESPRSFDLDRNFNFDNNQLFAMGRPKLGLKIQDVEEGTGVKVLDVEEDSPAEKAGLKKDDIITAVGDAAVNNTDEAREQLHVNAEKSSYPVKAKRNGTEMNFTIVIPKKLKTADL